MPPQRRQSFAPTSAASRSRQGLGRKRAQSLAASEADRQLAPRKSILKSTSFTFSADPGPLPQQEKEPLPQPPPHPTGTLEDDTGFDYRAEISDNTTRKSLGRRVSFAPLASFRVFESNDNTNSSGAPSSSPTPASPAEPEPSPPSALPLPPIQLSNENDYPGRRSNTAPLRRVSVASEYGERSMSLDMDQDSDNMSEPPTDPVFFTDAANGVADYGPPSTEEDFGEGTEEEDDDDDDDDMEITEAIAINVHRKRSLSIAQQHEMARRSSLSSLASRRRSSVKFPPAADNKNNEEDEADGDDVDGEDVTTNTQATQESDAPAEFTVALGQPLKKPKPPSAAWLALKAMTNGHSEGDDENEEEMELSNALSRLEQARQSFGFGNHDQNEDGPGVNNAVLEEDSFTTTDSSMDESIEDRTVNVTNIVRRVSSLEISCDDSERNIETMGDEDFAGPIPVASIATLNVQRKENAPVQVASSNVFSSSVFSAPAQSLLPAGLPSVTPPTGSEPDGGVPQRPQSPAITEDRAMSRPPLQLKSSFSTSVFSAPPPTPSRIPVPVSPSKSTGVTSGFTAKKRAAPPHDAVSDTPQPSPAKKRLLENSAVANRPPPSPILTVPASIESMHTLPEAHLVPRVSLGGMRRPSGYFAQRRSLAPGTSNTPSTSRSPSPAPGGQQALAGTKSSQSRRASIAAVPSAGQVQDENALTQSVLPPASTTINHKASASILTMPAPTVIVTPDDAQEDYTGPEMMDMETDKQELVVQRRSLVSSEATPTDEEFDDIPSISIKEFFLMTGVKFHEYTIPRRSTIHPSQLHGDRRDSSVPPSMADFLTAVVVHIPQLELYRLITKDLQTFIDNSMRIHREAEDEVAKLAPILFREFSQANEEGREELLHQLKLIKANRLIAAKERWYDVRSRWIQSLVENTNRGFAELEKDRDTLTSVIKQAQDLLPALRQQHAQVQLQLEKERTDVEEVENSDPGYLEELKITIDEQNQLLDVYRADVAEGNAKQERLEGKLAELEAQRLDNAQAIEAAERKIALNKGSTRAEVFRLRDELECLQVLHSWRVSKITRKWLELVFNEHFLVSVPCKEYHPIIANISVTRLDRNEEPKRTRKRMDSFPLFSDLIVRQGETFARGLSTTSVKRLIEALSDFWTSCEQIWTQFTFLGIKYPLTLEPLFAQHGEGLPSGIRAVVSILLHRHKAKVLVAFVFNQEILASWPFTIRKLQCEAKTVYGSIDSEEVRSAIMERLSEASVEDNHACLLDSCVEAASRFE